MIIDILQDASVPKATSGHASEKGENNYGKIFIYLFIPAYLKTLCCIYSFLFTNLGDLFAALVNKVISMIQ